MRLHTLGRLELLPDVPGATPVAAQPKRLALLAYLALATPRGLQRRDVLLGLFWPELDQDEARRALRQALHHLRQFLKDGVLVSRADEVVGVAEGALWCDAMALDEALATGRATQVLELYQGDFLEGCFVSDISAEFEQWVDRTRATLKRRAAQAAQSLAEQEEKAGNALPAILAGRRAVELAPDDESVVRQLIGLHRRFGDHAGALRTYDEFARRLAEEFGASPSAETLALIESIRAGPVAAATATGAAAQPLPIDRPAGPLPQVEAFDRTADFAEPRGDAPLHPVPVPANSRAVQRRAVVLVAATVLAAAMLHTFRPARLPTLPNRALVAVLPFRTTGAAPELAWLHEGMVDLLALKLSGQQGLRAVDPRIVMRAWRGVEASAGGQITPEAEVSVARRAGAGRAIDGGVVGTPARLTLTAALLEGAEGSVTARASVEGPMESLPALVDQLAARLLSLEAGTEAERLSSISSQSLPAIRAYLAGRASFRRGRLREALTHFREATVLDSSFALAALELVHASKWVEPAGDDAQRGQRLALAGRERLVPADQALLDVWTHPFQTRLELLQRWQAATRAYPELAEVWYGLGDAYYHYGMLAGLADPFALAGDAFQHGWALDSASGPDSASAERAPIFAEPLAHLVELAQTKGDTAAVHRLVALGLAADSVGAKGWYLRWHRAVALGAPAQAAFWADSQRFDPETFALIHRFTASSGVAATEDYLRSATHMLRHWELGDPDGAGFERRVLALNGGRPREAARALAGNLDAPSVSLGLPVREALYWGGDTTLAAEAAWRLVSYAGDVLAVGEAGQLRMQALCTLATWRLAHGDHRYAEGAVRKLRRTIVTGLPPDDSTAVAQYATLCAALLEASRAVALRLPNARAALERADTAARTYEVGQSLGANLVVARVAEAEGNLPFALRAVRRRASGYDLLPVWYLSSFLREEGRLAALTGDTTGAIRAYRHYLAIRPNPEPTVKPEVERIRAELGRLMGNRSGQ